MRIKTDEYYPRYGATKNIYSYVYKNHMVYALNFWEKEMYGHGASESRYEVREIKTSGYVDFTDKSDENKDHIDKIYDAPKTVFLEEQGSQRTKGTVYGLGDLLTTGHAVKEMKAFIDRRIA